MGKFAGILGFAAAALMSLLASTETWWGFEERAIGTLIDFTGGLPARDDVVVVLLGEEAFRKFGKPVPRELTARLIDALAGARDGTLTIDIAYDVRAFDGPAADAHFAAAAASHRRVITALDCGSQEHLNASSPVAPPSALGPGVTPAFRCGSTRLPIGSLGSDGWVGHYVLGRSTSGVARKIAAIVSADDQRYLSLSLVTFMVARGKSPREVEQRADALRADGLLIPVDERGDLSVSYRGDIPTYLYEDLIEALLPDGGFSPAVADQLRGKHVVLGISADSAGDVGPVATGRLEPLVGVHACLLSDLLDGRPMRDLPRPFRFGVALIAGLLLTLAAFSLQLWRGAVGLIALAVCSLWVASLGMRAGVYLGPLGPIVAGVLGWTVSTALRLSTREKERRVLRDAFGAYVDSRVLERVMSEPERYLALSGARKVVTVLFSDVVGFTALTNRLKAEAVVAQLREYLAVMTRVVVANGGRIDKIMGDGILAVFNDPIERADHPRAAVLAALEMREELITLCQHWGKTGRPQLQCRVGIGTGEVFVGNIGARATKLEYTVLGAVVNLASRLEGRAPPGMVLIAQATAALLEGNFELIDAPLLTLKGFDAPQQAMLVMGPAPIEGQARRQGRVATQVIVRVRVGNSGDFWTAEARNVSGKGVFVVTALVAELGDLVELEVPSSVTSERFKGMVRWKSSDGLGLELEAGREHLIALLRLDW